MPGKRKAESRRWFQQALYDLRAVRWNIEGGFHDTACFLAHQTGEKALKSLLYYLGARRQALLTHSLVEMIEGSGKKVKPVLELLEEGRSLDLHYIPSRYPNGLPSGYPHQFYGKEMSEKAVNAADRIFSSISQYYQTQGESEILSED